MSFTIDSDFPGGNIIVRSIEGDHVKLEQDVRDTTKWWFYWYFRVRNPGGRTVRFSFMNKDVFTSDGPCFSEDGKNWQWLGREIVVDDGFSFTFPEGVNEAFFSLGVPYVESNLREFLSSRSPIEQSVLCRTEHGRDAEMLRLRSKRPERTVVLSARTHACEAMASFALEGVLDFWLTDETDAGKFLRQTTDLLVFPFVDKDGVEQGDQGKLRSPHDHNRDYLPEPIYATTRAIMRVLREVTPPVRFGLDLHCPSIRGGINEVAYIVGPPEPFDAPALAFAKLVERTKTGALPFSAADFYPYGTGWNANLGDALLSRFVSRLPGCEVGFSVEVPYSRAGGVKMIPTLARGLGADLARAVALHFSAD
jgi:hypothetical protein